MTELIIGTYDELKIGEVKNLGTITNENLDEIKVAIQILAEVTKQDYLDFCKMMNISHLVINSLVGAKFFKIRILD